MKQVLVIGIGMILIQTVSFAQQLVESKSLSGANLKQLYVVTTGGDIRVESWDRSEIQVEISLNRGSEGKLDEFAKNYAITSGVSGDRAWVEIKSKKSSKWDFFNFTRSVAHTVTLKVPKKLETDLNTSGGDIRLSELEGASKLKTSGGDIHISDVLGLVTATTSGGDIDLKNITGKVYASTSGGDVDIEKVTGMIEASTSGGDIKVENAKGSVDVSTSGGDIFVDLRKDCDGIKAETSGGDVLVNIPIATKASIDARTSGGRVAMTDDLDAGFKGSTKKRDKVVGTINGGGPEIQLRTSGGDIRISGQ